MSAEQASGGGSSCANPLYGSVFRYAAGILDTVHEPIIVLDVSLAVVSANRRFFEVFGGVPEETLGRPLYELRGGQWDIPVLRRLLEQILPRRARVDEYEVEHEFTGVGRKALLINARRVWQRDDEAPLAILAIKDITRRRTIERELRESEANFRRAFETSTDGLLLIDKASGRIVGSNAAVVRLLGYDSAALTGRSPAELGLLGAGADYNRIAADLTQSGFASFDGVRLSARDGSIVHADVYLIDRGRLIQCGLRDITKRRRAEALLAERENRLRMIIESEPECVKLLSTDNRVMEMNPAGLAMVEADSADQVLGKNLLALVDRRYRQVFQDLTNRVFHGESGSLVFEITSFKGTHRWLETHAVPLRDGAGVITALLGITRDITDQKRAEDALAAASHYLDKIINSVADPIFVKNRLHRYVLLNDAFCSFLGYTREALLGKSEHDVFPVHEADVIRRQDDAVFALGEQVSSEEVLTDARGVEHTIVMKKNLYTDEKGEQLIVGIMQDITERKQLEETIRRHAFYDPLTDLPNRRLFIEHLVLEMAQAKRNDRRMAVLFLDLDHFKTINDTLGHAIGDALLTAVARRLMANIRTSDRAARLGGDEFSILLLDVTEPEETAHTALKLLRAVNRPYMISGHELHVTTSVGISIYPDDGKSYSDLLKHADMAMYHAKEKGRNTYQFYDASMNTRARERALLEHRLRRSIDRGELVVYYQPQVEIGSGRITSVEALVRWQHPTLGLIPPARFLPLAEETGLILAIDSWMLRTACTQNRVWQRSGLPAVNIAINLSARQFQQPNLAEIVSQILQETGMSPEHLDLEITENIAMRDIESSIPNLTRLTDMGVSFAIDDFGTGYTSLGWLRKLPIHKLKIDKSFIRDLEGETDSRAIINAIISLAHNLKLRVVAEGVENERAVDFLRSSGCDEMQGYVFSGALPAHEVESLMVH